MTRPTKSETGAIKPDPQDFEAVEKANRAVAAIKTIIETASAPSNGKAG